MSGCRPQVEKGIACPYCGEKSPCVTKTMPKNGKVFRYRKCQACGLSQTTVEVPVSVAVKAG